MAPQAISLWRPLFGGSYDADFIFTAVGDRGNLRRDRSSDRRFSRRPSGFDRHRVYRRAARYLAGERARRERDIRGEHRRKNVSDCLVNYRIGFILGVDWVDEAPPIQPICLRR